MMPLEFRLPSLSLADEFVALADDFRAAGEAHFVDEPILLSEGVAAYIAWLERGRAGHNLPPPLVPWTTVWVWSQEEHRLIGLGSFRPVLSPWMAIYGGHIGYRVRPSARFRGYGTAILHYLLTLAGTNTLSQALIVCEPDNLASIRVILANGGVWQGRVVREDNIVLNQYLVPSVQRYRE